MKVPVSTSIEDHLMKRIRALAEQIESSDASVVRRCVVQALPEIEKSVLGFVNRNNHRAKKANHHASRKK